MSPPVSYPEDTYYAWAVYTIYVNDGAIKYEDHCESASHRDSRREMLRQGEVEPWNAAHPEDSVALVWGQKYEMPEGVIARQ